MSEPKRSNFLPKWAREGRWEMGEFPDIGPAPGEEDQVSEQWTNGRTTASFTMADLMKVAAKISKPEPIMAFQGTAAQLAAAMPAAQPPPFVGPLWADSLLGLDVVEEDGWVYIGTTRQLAEARKRWGSLTEARRGADLFKTPVRCDGIGNQFA